MIRFKTRVIVYFIGFLAVLSQFSCQSTVQGAKMSSKNPEDNRNDMLKYYTSHSIMTDPGNYSYLYEDLPSGIPELCNVVQGVIIHIFWTKAYGVDLSEKRKEEVQIRKVHDKLARIEELDKRPLTFARELNNKLVGNCRDFAVLLTSLLRYKGIPARARCGFARYFTPGRYEDHWVCEYWNAQEKRWILVDAQLDSVQRKALAITFDHYDVPRDKFLTAGHVWTLCKAGELDANLCGIFDMQGLWFVRGNVVRDLMSLNKLEALPWDVNDLMDGPEKHVTDEEFTLLDRVAELTTKGNSGFPAMRSLYESIPTLQMPADWNP